MSAFKRFSFLYGWYLYSYVTRNCCALKKGAQQAIAKRPAASLLRIKPWVVIFINLLGFYISLEELFGYVSAFEYSDFCKKTKIAAFLCKCWVRLACPVWAPLEVGFGISVFFSLICVLFHWISMEDKIDCTINLISKENGVFRNFWESKGYHRW